MNNSTVDMESLVQQMNDEKAHLLIPATVYICILMITGIVGNLMVCFFYGFKTKPAPTTIFIITLSVYDLVVCFISMPTEVVDIVKFYTFTNAPACKILRFVNYFAAIASILTLIMIAVDRYRHICHVMGRQMTVGNARKFCLIVAGLALVLSWPSLVIYNAVKVTIPNSYGLDLKGSDCTSNKDKSFKPYVWAFNIVHFLLFIICSITLIVLYAIVGRAIYKHKQRIAKYKKSPLPSWKSSSTENDTEMSNTTENSTDKIKKDEHQQSSESNKATLDLKNSQCRNNKQDKKGKHQPKSRSFDKETIRMTLLMFVVTALFIISFLPYLSLTVWRIVEGNHEAEFLSDAGLVAFKIGSRSFLLNSSLNPWIYGIFNSKFRQYYYNLICCKNV